MRSVARMQNPTRQTVAEPESMAQLRGDCAHMAPHWPHAAPAEARAPQPLHGVRVPPASARLLEGMSEYGD